MHVVLISEKKRKRRFFTSKSAAALKTMYKEFRHKYGKIFGLFTLMTILT